jgi:flavin-dependent dehydrogenase
VFAGAIVRDVRRSANGFVLVVDGLQDDQSSELRARVVVDATGRRAVVAQRLGGVRRRYDNLVGMALRVHRLDDGAPTLIEAASLGWWSTSAIPGAETVAVFLTDADLLTRECIAESGGWRTLLDGAPHTAARIGNAIALGRPRAFAAATHVLVRAAGDGWLAVGDAAIGRDPISGSGIEFALQSAELAAHAVIRAFAGSRMAWHEYDARVSRDAGAYREQQMRHYAIERRWPDAPFWQRRHPRLMAA